MLIYYLKNKAKWGLLAVFAALLSACGSETYSNLEGSASLRTNSYFFAYRDGDGPWQVAIKDDESYSLRSRSLRVDDGERRLSAIFVCPSRDLSIPTSVYFYYVKATEIELLTQNCVKDRQQESLTQVVFGNFQGLAEDEQAEMTLGQELQVRGQEGFALEIPWGTRDLFAFRGKVEGNNLTQVDRFFIQRDLKVASSDPQQVNVRFDVATINSIQITGVSANELASASVGDSLLEGEEARLEVRYITDKLTHMRLGVGDAGGLSYTGVPVDVTGISGVIDRRFQRDSEGHVAELTVQGIAGGPIGGSAHFFKAPRNVSLGIGRSAVTPTVNKIDTTAGDLTRRRLAFSWQRPTVGLVRFALEGRRGGESAPNLSDDLEWEVFVSESLANQEDGSFTLAIPDLNNVDGWHGEWYFDAANPVSWTMTGYETDTGLGQIIDYLKRGTFYDGLNYKYTVSNGTLAGG